MNPESARAARLDVEVPAVESEIAGASEAFIAQLDGLRGDETLGLSAGGWQACQTAVWSNARSICSGGMAAPLGFD